MTHICEQLVAAAQYLERNGMSVQQLRALHHSRNQNSLASFASTYRYFGTNMDLGDKNVLYATRLIFVAEEHQKHGGIISSGVEKALAKWPVGPSEHQRLEQAHASKAQKSRQPRDRKRMAHAAALRVHCAGLRPPLTRRRAPASASPSEPFSDALSRLNDMSSIK
jgi:hypothetical protein